MRGRGRAVMWCPHTHFSLLSSLWRDGTCHSQSRVCCVFFVFFHIVIQVVPAELLNPISQLLIHFWGFQKQNMFFGCQSFLIKKPKSFNIVYTVHHIEINLLCQFELTLLSTEHLNVIECNTYNNHYALRSSFTSWYRVMCSWSLMSAVFGKP